MANPHGFSQEGIQLLYQELIRRGVSPQAATGAIAGIMGESGANIDPTSFNTRDPGGGSGGIGQWNRDRLVGPIGMLAFARGAGVPVDINTPTDAKKVPLGIQTQYLGHELDTRYRGVLNQLKATQSPQEALNIWVNSYENPRDKAGAIRQRSQYLAPVGQALNAAEAPGPIDPSIIARGGYSPPIPGTTIDSTPPVATTPAAPARADLDKKFAEDAQKFFGGGQAAQSEDLKAAQQAAFQPQPAHNVSPLIPPAGSGAVAPEAYGTTLMSMMAPLQWGAGAPGQAPYANVGGMGLSLDSVQQMQQQMMAMGLYGGDYG